VTATDDSANNRTVVTIPGAVQTPWTQNIDGGGFSLTNTNFISANNFINEAGYYGWRVGGLWRWQAATAGSESTGNAGSDFALYRFSDAEALIGTPLTITRSSGAVTWNCGAANFTINTTSSAYALDVTGRGRFSVLVVANATAAGQQADLLLTQGGISRWTVGKDASGESGSNAGSNFFIARANDAGGGLGNVLAISRATGIVDFNFTPTIGGVSIITKCQTPWLQNINGGHFDLTNVNGVFFSCPPSPTWSFCFNNQGGTLTMRRDDTWVTLFSIDGNGVFGALQLWARSATDANQNMTLIYDAAGDYGKIEVYHAGVGYRPLVLQPSSGNVGISKTNPGYKLDVAGDCNLQSGAVYRINGVDIRTTMQTPWLQNIAGAGYSLSNVGDIQVFSTSTFRMDLTADTAGAYQTFQSTGGLNRWQWKTGVAETGSNAGSDLFLGRYTDAGALIGYPFSIVRSTGVVNFTQTPTVNGTSIVAASQTPWLSDIDAAGHNLNNAYNIQATNYVWALGYVSTPSVYASSNLQAGPNGQPQIIINPINIAIMGPGAVIRWSIGANTPAETGGNSGSDFNIQRFSDAGATLGSPLTIIRATGVVNFSATPTVNGTSIIAASQTPWLQDINAANYNLSYVNSILVGSSGYTTLIYGYGTYFKAPGGTRWLLAGNTGTESGSNSGSDFYIQRFNDAGGTIDLPLVIQRSTGNVGVNVTAPTAKLDLQGALNVFDNNGGKIQYAGIVTEVGGQLINFGVNDTRFGFQNVASQGGFLRIATTIDPLFSFYGRVASATTPAKLAVLTSGGSMGIGAASPWTRLHVAGSNTGGFPTAGSPTYGVSLISNSDLNYGVLTGVNYTGEGWIQAQRVDGTATTYNLWLQPAGGYTIFGGNIDGGGHFINNVSFVYVTGGFQVISGTNKNTIDSIGSNYYTSGNLRWAFYKADTESGSNTGSNFHFYRYADDGSYLGQIMMFNRATGVVDFGVTPTINGTSIIAAAQTPWVQNVNGGGFNLSNVGTVTATNLQALNGGELLVQNAAGTIYTEVTSAGSYYRVNSKARWNMLIGNTETGSNTGSDFFFYRYDDAGTTLLGTALCMIRSNGRIGINNASPQYQLDVGGSIRTTGDVVVPSGWVYSSSGLAVTDGSLAVKWLIYHPAADPSLYIRDLVNSVMAMQFQPGTPGAITCSFPVTVSLSTNTPALVLQGATAGWASGIQFANTTPSIGRNFGIYSDSGGNFIFADNTSGTGLILINGTNHFMRVGSAVQPAYQLDVTGDCNISGTYRVNGNPLINAAQTPWLQNINGGGYTLSNVGNITSNGFLQGNTLFVTDGTNNMVKIVPNTIYYYIANKLRWVNNIVDTESGSNAGSNFYILRYADDGSYLGVGLSINRATGALSTGQVSSVNANGFINIIPNAGLNYIQSANSAGTVAQGLAISGPSAVTLPSFAVSATSSSFSGTLSSGAITATTSIACKDGSNNYTSITPTTVQFQIGNKARWYLMISDAESGSNSGSNFRIVSYDDPESVITERLRINRATGNVGIGNSSPSYNLDVAGQIRATNNIISGAQVTALGHTINGPNATANPPYINWYVAGLPRWCMLTGNAEAAGNVGSDWSFCRYDNAGTYLGAPISIIRATGVVNFETTPTIAGVSIISKSQTPWLQDIDGGNYVLRNAAQLQTGTATGDSVYVTKTIQTWSTNGNARWALYKADAETGSNAGSNFYWSRYSDAGAYLGNVLTINRASGVVNFPSTPTIGGVSMIAASQTPWLQSVNGGGFGLSNVNGIYSTVFYVGPAPTGTIGQFFYSGQDTYLGGYGTGLLYLVQGGTARFGVGSTGLLPVTDNTYDLGSSSYRIRDLYMLGNLSTANSLNAKYLNIQKSVSSFTDAVPFCISATSVTTGATGSVMIPSYYEHDLNNCTITGAVYGNHFLVIMQGSTTCPDFCVIETRPYMQGTGNIAYMTGMQSNPYFWSNCSGTISHLTGFLVQAGAYGGGATSAITNWRSFWSRAVNTTFGTKVTNVYGLVIDAQSQGTGTNIAIITSQASTAPGSWALYNSGTAPSYFAGSIGIGTTNPLGPLDIKNGILIMEGPYRSSRPAISAVRISNEISGCNSLAGDDGFLRISAGGGTDTAWRAWIDLSGYAGGNTDLEKTILFGIGTERMRIMGTGNVGINFNNPLTKLHVVGAAFGYPTSGSPTNSSLLVSNSSGGYGLLMGVNGDGTGWIQCQRADSTAALYNMVLQPLGGSVCIGNTTPSGYTLNVTGAIYASSAITGAYFISAIGNGLSWADNSWLIYHLGGVDTNLYFRDTTNAQMALTLQQGSPPAAVFYGKVSISNQPLTYALNVAGDCNVTGVYRINGVDIRGYAQTPWTQDVNANAFVLYNLSYLAIYASGANSNTSYIYLYRTAQARWYMGGNSTTEATGNVGTDFILARCDNTGASIGVAFQIMRSSGNVGVNCNSPSTRMQVCGTTSGLPTAGSATGSSFLVSNVDANYGMLMGVTSGGTGWIQSQRIDAGTTLYGLLLNPLGGNVGINNNNPGAALDVTGNVRALAVLANTTSIAAPPSFLLQLNASTRWASTIVNAEGGSNSGSDFALQRYSDAAGFLGITFQIIRSTGHAIFTGRLAVGGSFQPAYPLDVLGDVNHTGILKQGSSSLSGTTPVIYTLGAGQAVTGGTYTYPTGNQSATLVLQDTAATTGSGGMVAFGAGAGAFAGIKGLIQSNTSNTSGDIGFYVRFAGGDTTMYEAMRLLANGNLGVGKYPSYRLDVAGDVNLSSGSVYRVNGVAITGGGPTTFTAYPSGRVLGTVYTNSGSTPMFVSVVGQGSTGTGTNALAAYADTNSNPTTIVSVNQTTTYSETTGYRAVFFIVLPGYKYKVVATNMNLSYWNEWN